LFRKYFVDFTLVLVAIIWALNFSVVKIALTEIDPFSFNALRYIFAFLLLITVTWKRGFSLKVKREHFWKLVGLGLIGNLVYQGFFIIGINYTYSANAAVMLGTIPIWVALISQFFTDEKLTALKTVGIFFAFLGICFIIVGGKDAISFASESFIGDLIIIAAAVVWAIYTVLSKKYLRIYNSTQFSAFMALVGLISLSLVGLPFLIKLNWSGISIVGYSGVIYSGLLSVGIAYLIWNNGLNKLGAIRTSSYQNLVPVLGLVFGVIILDEQLTLFQYIGAAFVIAGIILARKKTTQELTHSSNPSVR